MSRYNLRSRKNVYESENDHEETNEVTFNFGERNLTETIEHTNNSWVMNSYDTSPNNTDNSHNNYNNSYDNSYDENNECNIEHKNISNQIDYSYNGYTWCEDYKDSTIYPNYDWVSSIADEWTYNENNENNENNDNNSYVTDDTIDIDENEKVNVSTNTEYNTEYTKHNTYLNFSYQDNLFLRKSIENIEYLSIIDVFRYVTLGNVISHYDFNFLQTDICNAIYGEGFEYPEDKMVSIYTNFNNYMMGEEPSIIKIIPFSFKHYRKIAKVCLDYAKDNNKYCVSVII